MVTNSRHFKPWAQFYRNVNFLQLFAANAQYNHILIDSSHHPTYQDTWLVGDDFLRDIYSNLTNMKNWAVLNRKRPPYLYNFYNVFGYFQNKQSLVQGMTRMFNAYVEALNNRKKLPKYAIFVPDVDLLYQIKAEDDQGTYIFHSIDWLLHNIENFTSRREFELFDKHPGALMSGTPKFIWVKMLKWPEEQLRSFPVFGMRNKFNNTLEAMLAYGKSKFEHLILSIDVAENFDQFRGLTTAGKDSFWRELNSCIRRFEMHQINLKPKAKSKNKKKARHGTREHDNSPHKGSHRCSPDRHHRR